MRLHASAYVSSAASASKKGRSCFRR
jgi:hypothetical protein